jgi:hypothetical protein
MNTPAAHPHASLTSAMAIAIFLVSVPRLCFSDGCVPATVAEARITRQPTLFCAALEQRAQKFFNVLAHE